MAAAAPPDSGLQGSVQQPWSLRGLTLLALGMVSAIAPLSTSIYLPALPDVAADLGTTPGTIELTLTTFMIGMALGQVVIGPLSDRHGRRPLLLLGIAGFAVASVGCALAPSAALLVLARCVQGFAGSAGMVLGRAVVADLVSGAAAARLISALMLVGVLVPAVAPLVGSGVLPFGGWRIVFWVLAGLGVVMLVGVLRHVPESLPSERRSTGGVGVTLAAAWGILRNRAFVVYALVLSLGFTGYYATVAAGPFLIQGQLGMSPFGYAWAVGMFALVGAAGTVTVLRLVGRESRFGLWSPHRLAGVGLTVAVVATGLLTSAVLVGAPEWTWLASLALLSAGMPFILGNATALALDQARSSAGTGSAVLGVLQNLLGASAAPLVGLGGHAPAIPMACLALGGILAAAACFVVTSAATARNVRLAA